MSNVGTSSLTQYPRRAARSGGGLRLLRVFRRRTFRPRRSKRGSRRRNERRGVMKNPAINECPCCGVALFEKGGNARTFDGDAVEPISGHVADAENKELLHALYWRCKVCGRTWQHKEAEEAQIAQIAQPKQQIIDMRAGQWSFSGPRKAKRDIKWVEAVLLVAWHVLCLYVGYLLSKVVGG